MAEGFVVIRKYRKPKCQNGCLSHVLEVFCNLMKFFYSSQGDSSATTPTTPKTTENNNTSGSSWSWNSWINAAKNKSTEVLELVKKDLEELGTVVKNEASSMVQTPYQALERTLKLNDTADSMKSTAGTMKRTFSSFLGQMNNVLNPSPDDSDTEAVIITGDNTTVPLTKLQQAVYELQIKSETFLKDPDASLSAQYECWLEIISDQLTESRLAKHLTSSDVLSEQYKTLCPEHVTHETFWKRYLFKKALLEDHMACQEALEKKQKQLEENDEENNIPEVVDTEVVTTEDFKWEEESADISNIELTEEEQVKLLEQYENEFKTKQQKAKKKKNKVKAQSSDEVSSNSAETKSSSSSLDGEWECVTPEKI